MSTIAMQIIVRRSLNKESKKKFKHNGIHIYTEKERMDNLKFKEMLNAEIEKIKAFIINKWHSQ